MGFRRSEGSSVLLLVLLPPCAFTGVPPQPVVWQIYELDVRLIEQKYSDFHTQWENTPFYRTELSHKPKSTSLILR